MNHDPSLRVSRYLFTALFLTVGGLAGLIWLFLYIPPTVGPRWLFFFLLVVTLTGLTLPITAFLNRRFTSNPPATPFVVIRQSTWAGVYVATIVWLQIGRVLTTTLAILLFVGLILIEFLLRLNERSQWKPQ